MLVEMESLEMECARTQVYVVANMAIAGDQLNIVRLLPFVVMASSVTECVWTQRCAAANMAIAGAHQIIVFLQAHDSYVTVS
jgi:predicted FMN-binding regulatory protein PaiB